MVIRAQAIPVTTNWLDQTRGLAGGGDRSIANRVAFLSRCALVPSAGGPDISVGAWNMAASSAGSGPGAVGARKMAALSPVFGTKSPGPAVAGLERK